LAPQIPQSQHTITLLGLGIAIPTHTDAWTLAELQRSDAAYHLLAGPIEVEWINKIRPDAISLMPFYSQYKARIEVYRAMADAVIQSARKNRLVAVMFYGHPMVGSTISQLIWRAATRENIFVRALPSISSMDCLFADLGFDPMLAGVLIADASQIIHPAKHILPNRSVPLILLQVGLTGIYDVPSFSDALHPNLDALIEVLVEVYSIEHEVALYEAPVHLAFQPKVQWCPIRELDQQSFTLATTLFVPSRL